VFELTAGRTGRSGGYRGVDAVAEEEDVGVRTAAWSRKRGSKANGALLEEYYEARVYRVKDYYYSRLYYGSVLHRASYFIQPVAGADTFLS
jgi:hypothetical protein